MAFVCEDLAPYGVALIPPSAAEYFELLSDIERRLHTRPKGSPPVSDGALSVISEHDTTGSAILVNRASAAIVSMAYVWWFRTRDDRIVPHSFSPGTSPSALLPFGLHDRSKKFNHYWNTIFPGSKRFFSRGGSVFGDNTDVRPPASDELSQGGFISFGDGSDSESLEEAVKLTLDGVFFEDGGFAGPDKLGIWEETTFSAETYLACAALAREATTPNEFFMRVQNLTGYADNGRMPVPPPPAAWLHSESFDPEPIRRRARQMVGWRVFSLLKPQGDEAAMQRVKAWADAPVPHFHKLAAKN